MGLFVFAVLQAVFDTSQESIGGQQLVADLLVQQTGRALTAQSLVQAGGLQGRLPSTAYQLIELNHKLNFSNPAIPQLDVVPGLHAIAVQGAACPVLTDALAQAAQGGQGIKVKILAIHKRGTQRFEVMYIAGATAAFKGLGLDGARLDPGIAFPFPALIDQIVFQGLHAPGQRPRITVRAQAQVGAKHLAEGVSIRQHGHHALGHFAVKLVIAQGAATLGFAVLVVEHDQVNVRGNV